MGDGIIKKLGGVSAGWRKKLPKKCRQRFIKPLKVYRKLGDVSVKIEVPPQMKKAHNVIHVSWVKLSTVDSISKAVDVIIDADENSD